MGSDSVGLQQWKKKRVRSVLLDLPDLLQPQLLYVIRSAVAYRR